MLGPNYRYVAYNDAGVNVTVTVNGKPWKFASDGSRTDGSESTHINAVSVADNAYQASSGVNNASDKYLGEKLTITLAPSASATGPVAVMRQESTNAGTTWPSDGEGEPVAVYYFAASSATVVVQGEA